MSEKIFLGRPTLKPDEKAQIINCDDLRITKYTCKFCGYRCTFVCSNRMVKKLVCPCCNYNNIEFGVLDSLYLSKKDPENVENVTSQTSTSTKKKGDDNCVSPKPKTNSKVSSTESSGIHGEAQSNILDSTPQSSRSDNKLHLNRHINSQTGEKKYTCSNCEYTSSRKLDMVRHMRRHTEERRTGVANLTTGFTHEN